LGWRGEVPRDIQSGKMTQAGPARGTDGARGLAAEVSKWLAKVVISVPQVAIPCCQQLSTAVLGSGGTGTVRQTVRDGSWETLTLSGGTARDNREFWPRGEEKIAAPAGKKIPHGGTAQPWPGCSKAGSGQAEYRQEFGDLNSVRSPRKDVGTCRNCAHHNRGQSRAPPGVHCRSSRDHSLGLRICKGTGHDASLTIPG